MKRPKWSTAVIGLALIAALAIVSPGFGVSIKKLVKKEVAKQIGKIPPGASGANGAPGANGALGPRGADGTARAYARVVPHASDPCTDGASGMECTFDLSKGITRVTRNGMGSYCVTAPGISPASVAVALTVDMATTPFPQDATSAMTVAGTACGDGFLVVTQRQQTTTVCANDACTATESVAGEAIEADNVGFTIVIP